MKGEELTGAAWMKDVEWSGGGWCNGWMTHLG